MSDPPAPVHTGPCTRSLDGDGEPLGYCVTCYQAMHDPEPCPECRVDECHDCDGRTWDLDADCHTDCPCAGAGHE